MAFGTSPCTPMELSTTMIIGAITTCSRSIRPPATKRGVIVANYNDMPNYNRLVPRAEVQMSDVNGPRGGIDKRCRYSNAPHSAENTGMV